VVILILVKEITSIVVIIRVKCFNANATLLHENVSQVFQAELSVSCVEE